LGQRHERLHCLELVEGVHGSQLKSCAITHPPATIAADCRQDAHRARGGLPLEVQWLRRMRSR
jgi:hypothetical protein